MSINPTDETVDLTEKSGNEEQNENMKSKVGTEDLSAGKNRKNRMKIQMQKLMKPMNSRKKPKQITTDGLPLP